MLNKNFIEETNDYASQLICNIFLKSYSLDQFYDEGCKIIDMQKTLITTYQHHQHAENFSKTCKALCTAISFLIKRIETITDHKYECDSIEYKNQMSKALTLGESCSVDFLDDIAIKSLKETIERLKKKVGFIFDTPPSLSVSRTSNKINIGSPYIVIYSFNRPVPCTISVKEDGFSIKSCGTPKIDIDKKITTYTCQFIFQSFDTFKIPIAQVDYHGNIFSSPQLEVKLHQPELKPIENKSKPIKEGKYSESFKDNWDRILSLLMFLVAICALVINNMLESWILLGTSITFMISRILSYLHATYPYRANAKEADGIPLHTINGCGIMETPIMFERKRNATMETISANSLYTSTVSYVFITFLYLPLIPLGCYSIGTLWTSKIYKGSKRSIKYYGQDRMHITEILQIYLSYYSLVLYIPALFWFIYSLF